MPIVPLREEEVPFYTHIVADSDMDGLFGAAVLRAFRPEATVTFSHAAALRGGLVDASIDRDTVLVDLPFHPACGWYVDHHLTNRPDRAQAASFEAVGGTQHWEATPSAARLAYDLLADITDMGHLAPMMPVVDALDSGGITKEAFLADGPLMQLSRTCTSRDPAYMLHLVNLLANGASLEDLLADAIVEQRCREAAEGRAVAQRHVEANTTVHDRLAVCRMDETGYAATATWSRHGWVTPPTRAASCTVTPTVISPIPIAHPFPPVSMRIPFSSTGRGSTTCRGWPRLLMRRGVVTPTLAGVGFNLRGSRPTWLTGWTCGPIETLC